MKRIIGPGNIRALENRIKRVVIMAQGTKVGPEDLELTVLHAKYGGRGLKEAREALKRDFVQNAIFKNKGNMT